jgi:hypothetical protein
MDYPLESESDYWSMQYALFITMAFLFGGGIIFLSASFFVVADKRKVDLFYERKYLSFRLSVNIYSGCQTTLENR